MTKTSGKTFKCNHCKTQEYIPEGEFGLKTAQIKSILCPICMSKGHKYKMKEVKNEMQT